MSNEDHSDRSASLGAVFAELKSILHPYAGGLVMRKADVSFHLMPIYVRPRLLDDLSPALKKRMQGKSCFNFAVIDPALLQELAQLTAAGFSSYKEQGFIDGT
jgi:hypothetical protein